MKKLEQLKKEYEQSINYLKKFESKSYIFKNCLREIYSSYQTIAWYNWFVKNDILETKNGLFNSSMTILKANQLFDDGTETASLLSYPRIALSEIALSDSKEIFNRISNLDFLCPIKDGKLELFSSLIQKGETKIYSALIIKSLVGDLDGLQKLLNILENNPRAKKKNEWFREELSFFEGIVENDKDKVLNTINYICSPYRHKLTNSYNGMYKELLSFPAIGYAKIAWLNNIEIEFENDLIINDLLPVNKFIKYENKIDSLIPKMTLKSDYKFHNGWKVKEKNDVFNVFIFSNPRLHGKACIVEELIPDIYDFEPRFIGLKTGKIYYEGLLIGTHRKFDSNILFDLAQKNKNIDLSKKQKALYFLQEYLNKIEELSKTYRSGMIMIERKKFNLKRYGLNENISKLDKNPSLSRIKKEGLFELGKLCLSKLGYDIYQEEIIKLKDYDSDSEYGSTLNYLSEILYENGLLFLVCLDWKAEMFQFETFLTRCLKENFSKSLQLNLSEKYSKKSSTSSKRIFHKYNNILKTNGFEITFLDTGNDSYIFFVNKLLDNEKIKSLIEKIGFKKLKIENGL